LNICKTVATASKCLSRKIGAIIVRDKSIISTGYNGPPRGVCQCDQRWDLDLKDLKPGDDTKGICPRKILGYASGQGLHLCNAGHAERNALINAAREGVSTKGCVMYMDCAIPCVPCLVEIINAGIVEVVCSSLTIYDERKSLTHLLLDQGKLKVRTYEGIELV
jgi:dCMP deaminase